MDLGVMEGYYQIPTIHVIKPVLCEKKFRNVQQRLTIIRFETNTGHLKLHHQVPNLICRNTFTPQNDNIYIRQPISMIHDFNFPNMR